MPCEDCRPKLRRLKPIALSRPVHDVELDALVWPDERVDFCPECAREYRVVLNVRTQLWNDERPSVDFRRVWDRFREECPFWIGFRRKRPPDSAHPNRGSPMDEVRDED